MPQHNPKTPNMTICSVINLTRGSSKAQIPPFFYRFFEMPAY